jgi:hypothetical protein
VANDTHYFDHVSSPAMGQFLIQTSSARVRFRARQRRAGAQAALLAARDSTLCNKRSASSSWIGSLDGMTAVRREQTTKERQ